MGAPEPPGVELLGVERDDPADAPRPTVDLIGPNRSIAAAAAALTVLALITIALWPSGSAGTDDQAQPVPALMAEAALPGDGDGLDATDGRSGLETAPWDIEPLPRSVFGLQAVVDAIGRDASRLLRVDFDGQLTTSDLPPLSDYAFDASGHYLAGIGTTRAGRARQVLWVGRTDGQMEPLAVDVTAFAWHETTPGHLAWSEAGTEQLSLLDLGDLRGIEVVDLPIAGLVRNWGEWGYGLDDSGFDDTTSLVAPDGRPIALNLPGRFVGHLGDGALLVSGVRADEPAIVDATTGERRPTGWLDANDHLWAMTGSTTGEIVALIDRRSPGRPFEAELSLVTAGEAGPVVLRTGTFTHLTWTPGGKAIIVTDTIEGWSPLLVVDPSDPDGRAASVALPDVFPGGERVAALSYLDVG